MIKLTYDQLVQCIYSSDPVSLYEETLESLRNQKCLTAHDNSILSQSINETMVNLFDAEDDGFSDDWVEEDYRDPFFDDHCESYLDINDN